MPCGVFEFWKVSGTIREWLYYALPVFVWGGGVTLFLLFIADIRLLDDMFLYVRPLGYIRLSIWAGVVEEVGFRWLFFLVAIVLLKIINFLGFGVLEWSHMNIAGPAVNFLTLYGMENYIYHSSGWALGASIIVTNAVFAYGHKYNPVALINSWFIGMLLFLITFKFGLPVAIGIHIVYDLLVLVICPASVLYFVNRSR